MAMSGKDVYFVAVKLLVRDEDRLLITHDVFGSWDIQGGRIKPDEFEFDLKTVIERKIVEELGSAVKLVVGQPVVFFRHERVEHSSGEKVRIFAVGHEAVYVSGELALGQHHDRFEWVDVATFEPRDYFEGGWLNGLEEYLESVR